MAQGSFGSQLGMAQNTHATIWTASNSQTRELVLESTDWHAATGNTIPPLYLLAPQSHSGLQGMASQSLTPQIGSLNIANTASGQEREKCAQTAASGNFFTLIPTEAMGKQSQGNGSGSTVGRSKQNSVVNAELNCTSKIACMNQAIKERNDVLVIGKSESVYEVRF